jgi:hypothetical protein
MRGSVMPAALIFMCSYTAIAGGQEVPDGMDSAHAELHTTLRRFYFNLARRDWDALTADILAAKVVAHRPVPAPLLRELSPVPAGCASGSAALRDRAHITVHGQWAEIVVPRCGDRTTGGDTFRLIHFEGRWRFVFIDLDPSAEPGKER